MTPFERFISKHKLKYRSTEFKLWQLIDVIGKLLHLVNFAGFCLSRIIIEGVLVVSVHT